MNSLTRSLLCFVMSFLFSASNYAADITAGEKKATACVGCHGPEGNSTNPLIPNLAGQQALYLNNQINAFKENQRTNAIMPSQVKQLRETDIEDIAAYFASRSTKRAGGNATLAKAGEAKASQCAGCHIGSFKGRSGFPRLAGQQSAYLVKQLHSFKSGERKSRHMQAIAANLTDIDIDQLAAYLSSLE